MIYLPSCANIKVAVPTARFVVWLSDVTSAQSQMLERAHCLELITPPLRPLAAQEAPQCPLEGAQQCRSASITDVARLELPGQLCDSWSQLSVGGDCRAKTAQPHRRTVRVASEHAPQRLNPRQLLARALLAGPNPRKLAAPGLSAIDGRSGAGRGARAVRAIGAAPEPS